MESIPGKAELRRMLVDMIRGWGGRVPLEDVKRRLQAEGFYLPSLLRRLEDLGVAIDSCGWVRLTPILEVEP